MSAIILDLDNTIADDGWRIPYIMWHEEDPFRRYSQYHELSPHDKAGNIDLFEDCEHDIFVLTARPVFYRPLTEWWLEQMEIDFKKVYMRPYSDHSDSVELKRKQLSFLLLETGIKKHEIVGAYDDREDVVQMYLAEGIPAEVRKIHNISYKPQKEAK